MTGSSASGIIACHECDHLWRELPIPAGARADCGRCGAELYRHVPNSLDRCLALYLTALVLFVLAHGFPFLTMEIAGRVEASRLVTAGWALYRQGMGELGLVVFATSILFPLVVVLGMLWLLVPARLGRRPPGLGPVFRLVAALLPWSLIGVFMLGTLVAVVKLQDLARVIPGVALFAFAGLLAALAAARANFDPRVLWATTGIPQPEATALGRDPWVSCHTCGLVRPEGAQARCPRCGTPLHRRIVHSVQRTWALLAGATLLLIPANVFPIMTVRRFGQGEPDTILSGVTHLVEGGMWGLALVVFFASIVVPVGKLGALAWLLRSVQRRSPWRPRDRTLLYRVTEVIGAWSMVDVFLVGLLSGLVSLDALASISPELGASFFAAVVVLTMLAAHSFDPRLIWDHAVREPGAAAEPAAATDRAGTDRLAADGVLG